MDEDFDDHNGYFQTKNAFLFSINAKKKYLQNGNGYNSGNCEKSYMGLAFGDDLYFDFGSGGYGYAYPNAY